MSKLINWFKFKVIFRLALRYNWNYTTTYKGRVWSNRKGFDWRKQRIYFSGNNVDFSPSAGGYTEVNDLASTNSKPSLTHTKSAQSDPKRKANT